MPISNPKLSVIIPCFNQGHFLEDAISSINALNYTFLEIILIDDGSTDNTRAIAQQHNNVQYYYQDNKGLPAARNFGISKANGDFVSFLDADDWYLPHGLITNLEEINQHDDVGFISGCHIIHFEDGHEFTYCISYIEKDHYRHFLEGNYIGNPSAVIYRKKLLESYPFDTSKEIVGCEDYDQYLKISKANKVLHNPIPISVYRRHPNNMSNNHAMMLNSVLNVLNRQKALISTDADMKALYRGILHWMNHYDYLPFSGNGIKYFQRYHWELIKKYNIRLPEMLMRKLRKNFISKTK